MAVSGGLLIATLGGCGGGKSGPTEADLRKAGGYWDKLEMKDQLAVAKLCRQRAIRATDNKDPSDLRVKQLRTTTVDSVASELSSFYGGGHSRTPIRRACPVVSLRAVPPALIDLPPGSNSFGDLTAYATRQPVFSLRGTVEPANARVTIAAADANRDPSPGVEGWGREHPVKVRNGKFTVRLALRRGDRNSFRLSAQSATHRLVREYIGIERKRTLAEERLARQLRQQRQEAARQRREASRQERIQRQTLSYSGNGGKNIGTIKIPRDSTLSWTCDGGLFQIFEDSGGLYVNSEAHSGTTDAPAGTYTGVTINALGNWSITIRPKG